MQQSTKDELEFVKKKNLQNIKRFSCVLAYDHSQFSVAFCILACGYLQNDLSSTKCFPFGNLPRVESSPTLWVLLDV